MGYRGGGDGPRAYRPGNNQRGFPNPRQEQQMENGPFENVAEIKSCIDEQLESPKQELFGVCAEGFAKMTDREGGQRKNKSTQIRRFFEEIVLWDERCAGKTEEEFKSVLPFIQLLRSKVHYSKGRDLISQGLMDVLSHLFLKINSLKTLTHARRFMEASIGYRRALEK